MLQYDPETNVLDLGSGASSVAVVLRRASSFVAAGIGGAATGVAGTPNDQAAP